MTDAPLDLDALVAKLTLEQKVRLLSGADWWTLAPEPAVGLRAMALSDGPVGVRGTRHDETDPSANAPSASAIAASWDVDLVADLARLLAAEARRKEVDVVLGPTINLHRSPLGGRHFECYSEDPWLTSVLGTAYVVALQACGVGATPKHYVANDSETDRFTVDVRVDERTLREVYLRPFEEMVCRGGAWLVMAAYNSVNGTTMTEHPLLAEPLKGEWGFDGVVVSDWFAARTTVAAGNGGLDLAMPADNSPWGDELVAAVRAGTVDERAVDDKVRRLLRLASRVGALAGAPAALAPPRVEAAPLLRRLASAGSVLLTNRDELLPLRAEQLSRVAVLGPHAAAARTQGGGSSEVHPGYVVSPLAGVRAALAGVAEVTHVAGTRLAEGLEPVAPPLVSIPTTGEPGLLVELLAADGTVLKTEHRRAGRLRYTSGDLPDGVARLRASTRLCADEPGQWRFGFRGVGEFTLAVAGETVFDEGAYPADLNLVDAFHEPPERAVSRTLDDGETVELTLTYEIPVGAPATLCMLGFERPPYDPAAEQARAVAAAAQSDVAVVVVGTTEQVESEGADRRSLRLPGDQDALVRAVAEANPRTVVVVCAGSPVELPWRDQVGAVLLTWFGGQELGDAVADLLLGVAEPGGRLPTSWPATEADVPVLTTTPEQGQLPYPEGIHIGYRAWLRSGREPAFPFGYGLGYTSWEYESLRVVGTTAVVTLRNTGRRAGKEVVQAYLSRPDSSVERPVRWLAGFAVANAEPGQQVSVEVPLDPYGFGYWSVAQHRWVTEPGEFTLSVGRNVGDTPLTSTVSAPVSGS
ncbi:glycoside hydrolase family 3 C-terminal domain-containing protein [Natronosporangium hydrolyticum]|uniref:Glycoside hydrolase family 3 C-terminal domain-containing protein n=1 Tax=Natronosporangium hydrolyticum TaxID=2811111 RepID=A0A895Y584_9ACTN|nr:glycoside hydrolase family 3 C-terminal domain-containing protein [Natronosporangium hydrolyticum]QSB12864.1 glycoside hydrolase family 3 C-terminal domain-containing protein [Natronosporangium hydrolyticum]